VGDFPVGFNGANGRAGTLEPSVSAGTQRLTRTRRTIRENGKRSTCMLAHGGVVAMKRWFVCSLFATALLAARGGAQEPAQLASPDYFADAGIAADANCP